LAKNVGDHRELQWSDPQSGSRKENGCTEQTIGRVGTEVSATALSLALIVVLRPGLYAFQLEQMKSEIEAGPHQTFEAWRENITVSGNVNWNHCYKGVAEN
jgi:hypothetical protein